MDDMGKQSKVIKNAIKLKRMLEDEAASVIVVLQTKNRDGYYVVQRGYNQYLDADKERIVYSWPIHRYENEAVTECIELRRLWINHRIRRMRFPDEPDRIF